MSNEYMKAADALKREVVRFQGLNEAAAVLEKIGSLAQAEEETKARLAQLQKDVATAQDAVKAAQDEADRIREAAVKNAAVQHDSAVRAFREAQEEAAKTIAEADMRAAHIVADAKRRAEAQHSELRKEFEQFQAGKAEAEKALAGVKREIAEKSAELSQIEDRINKARRAVAEMLR